ncbi:MAG: hypothetical protein WD431_02355 [Cyclobacteriaceae bacterium]
MGKEILKNLVAQGYRSVTVVIHDSKALKEFDRNHNTVTPYEPLQNLYPVISENEIIIDTLETQESWISDFLTSHVLSDLKIILDSVSQEENTLGIEDLDQLILLNRFKIDKIIPTENHFVFQADQKTAEILSTQLKKYFKWLHERQGNEIIDGLPQVI